MKARRPLAIRNLSSYPDDWVREHVRRGLVGLDTSALTVIVADTRRRDYGDRHVEYSGYYWGNPRRSAPRKYVKLMAPTSRYLFVVRLGPESEFPIKPFRRNGFVHDFRSAAEALVGVTAHEGKHIEHLREGVPTSERRCEAWETKVIREFRLEEAQDVV